VAGHAAQDEQIRQGVDDLGRVDLHCGWRSDRQGNALVLNVGLDVVVARNTTLVFPMADSSAAAPLTSRFAAISTSGSDRMKLRHFASPIIFNRVGRLFAHHG
jgi:hypothetical protein